MIFHGIKRTGVSRFARQAATQIQNFVTCGASSIVKQSHDMPHAEVPFGGMAGSTNEFGPGQGFWMDAFAQDDLNKFLASQNIKCN